MFVWQRYTGLPQQPLTQTNTFARRDNPSPFFQMQLQPFGRGFFNGNACLISYAIGLLRHLSQQIRVI